jgi:hypothetical protein
MHARGGIGIGVPALQVPAPSHVGADVQAVPEPQLVPAACGVYVMPVDGLHEPTMHATGGIAIGVPALQVPLPSQVDWEVHASPAPQTVPAVCGV